MPGRAQHARAPSGDLTREIEVGDRVRLLSFGSTGIVDQIKDDEAEVRVGSLRMREQLSNLELVTRSAATSGMKSVPPALAGGSERSLESLKTASDRNRAAPAFKRLRLQVSKQ